MKPTLKLKLLTAVLACLLPVAVFAGHGHSRARISHSFSAPVHAYAGGHHESHRYRGHDRGYHYGYSRGRIVSYLPRTSYYFSYYQPYAYPPVLYGAYAPVYPRALPYYPPGGLYFGFSIRD